jgi:hypothetical protein
LRRLDHAAIFTLIAGTFTPIHAIVFRGIFRIAAADSPCRPRNSSYDVSGRVYPPEAASAAISSGSS